MKPWRHSWPIHPHVRGDNASCRALCSAMFDSPPRAWGQRQGDGRRHLRGRFTPTCVGTTQTGGLVPRSESIHPHVRGDNRGVYDAIVVFPDSPPRAWGQRRGYDEAYSGYRFTPTCVGTTCSGRFGRWGTAIHPHVRGDNAEREEGENPIFDSPPRAWGQPPRSRRGWTQSRFTPTCVGTTKRLRKGKNGETIHPHVRGDNAKAHSSASSLVDSPPRAWGQRAVPAGELITKRFTPTCVGTT